MKRVLLSCLISTAICLPALAALKDGDKAPDFTAQASLAGKEFKFSLKESLKKGPVVVYFYPSAYTQGCNLQARTFSVNQEKFAAAGASVVGVSLDSIQRLNQFSADPDYCAGKFPVASDADGSIAKSYDLSVRQMAGLKDTKGNEVDHGLAERTTFVVTPDGKIAATIGGVKPDENVMKALETVQKLKAKS
ncbi:MAG TPA: peroxiredoxin [Steroidobacter sp.]|nr:peroxiredoxin [Steroidobacter sp.]